MLKKGIFALLLLSVPPSMLLLTPITAFSNDQISGQLELVAGTSIANSEGKDLSGLTFCHGKLLTVSDKDDDTIYSIESSEDGVSVVEYLKFESPSPKYIFVNGLGSFFKYWLRMLLRGSTVDYEGITCTPESTVLLASEMHTAVLEVSQDGSSSWKLIKLYEDGYDNGLFATHNAYIEGIAAAADGTLVMAAEREPSGYIVYADGSYSYLVNDNDASDLSGLFFDNGFLYTLERRGSRVCKREIDNLQKTLDCKSYGHTSGNPDYKYVGSKFNLEEGLALNDSSIFIVMDVNRRRRETDGSQEAMLFQFKRPVGF